MPRVGVIAVARGRGSVLGTISLLALTHAIDIGKGIKEPCAPYRVWDVFGAELGMPGMEADLKTWNCPPAIKDPTSFFDVRSIEPDHELFIILCSFYNVPAGVSPTVRRILYRDSDNKVVGDLSYTLPDPGKSGYTAWAIIQVCYFAGYLSKRAGGMEEINQNGVYHADILWDDTLLQRVDFNVLGVPPAEAEPVGKFVDNIFSFVWSISDVFYAAHLIVRDWITPFNLLDVPILALYKAFFDLLTPISHFGDWVDDLVTKVSNILSSVDIINLLKTWLTYAEDAWAWVDDAAPKVWGLVTEWWRSTNNPIRPFIDNAIQVVKDLVAGVQKELTDVHTAWDDFWTITYPTLISARDANDLMDTKVKETKPFWEGWSDVKDNVVKFISTPLDWLLDKFTDWFLGKE